ncbi:MAG: Holliday junction branch migration protein RuvA [Candidatus Acidiferrales bacterium]
MYYGSKSKKFTPVEKSFSVCAPLVFRLRVRPFDSHPALINNPFDMIGALRGKLIEKRPNMVLVDVGGVAYVVQVSLATFAALPALHSEAALLVHTHVREDAIALYGFFTAREKHCFELLISASGVGPSLAMKILSGISVEDLVPAIRRAKIEELVRIPGVGKKTAERMVVELRDKLTAIDVPDAARPATRSQLEADVASALENLGYEAKSVERSIEAARGPAAREFETLLRAALQSLGGPAMHKSARAGRDE